MAVLAQEVTKIICVADSSSSLQSKYFTISGMGADFEQNDYYVWIEVGGSGGTDPGVSGTAIPVSVAADASDSTVATAVSTAIHAKPDFSTSVSTTTITVTNAVRGSVSDAAILILVEVLLLVHQLKELGLKTVIINIQKMIWLGLFKVII